MVLLSVFTLRPRGVVRILNNVIEIGSLIRLDVVDGLILYVSYENLVEWNSRSAYGRIVLPMYKLLDAFQNVMILDYIESNDKLEIHCHVLTKVGVGWTTLSLR